MNQQQSSGPTPMFQQQFGCGQSLLIVTLLFGGLCVVGMVAGQVTRPPPQSPPISQRLRGVAIYKSRASFRVCSRSDLHQCVIRWGYRNGGDSSTLRSPMIPLIRAVPSCETQSALANESCHGEAAILSNDAGVIRSAVACMDGYGFIYRSEGRFQEIDPRDTQEHLAPGSMRIDCAEGYDSGSFDDTI